MSVTEEYHLCSQYFTTQGSDSKTALGHHTASHPHQELKRNLSKIECQVSVDGTLKCPLLYGKKRAVMYSKAQGDEQKQEGEEMYSPYDLFDTMMEILTITRRKAP